MRPSGKYNPQEPDFDETVYGFLVTAVIKQAAQDTVPLFREDSAQKDVQSGIDALMFFYSDFYDQICQALRINPWTVREGVIKRARYAACLP
jgi:hypothetical protein